MIHLLKVLVKKDSETIEHNSHTLFINIFLS